MSRREFQFSDGSSNKFWAIEVNGTSQTVHFGKVGTTGQAQTKEFASEAEAVKASDKLIAEKVKKGYTEVTTGTKSGDTPPAAKVKPAKSKTAKEQKATAEDAEPEAAATPPAASDGLSKQAVNTEVVRRIDLNPTDWYWAKWRNLAPLPRPKPRPFDFEACLAQLETGYSYYSFDYERRDRDTPVMSAEEARFWFEVLCDSYLNHKEESALGSDEQRKRQLKRMRKRDRQPAATVAEVTELMQQSQLHPFDLCYFLPILPIAELVELVLNPNLYTGVPFRHHPLLEFVLRFHYEVIPYLLPAETAALRARVARELKIIPPLGNTYDPFPIAFYLGGLLGCHNEIEEFIRSWPDNRYSDRYAAIYQYPEFVLYGLNSPGLVEAEARRLGFKPNHLTISTRGWLAHTEHRALDVIGNAIANAWNKGNAEMQFGMLSRVKAPEVAPVMLELSLGGKMIKLAREWLQTEVGNAIAGLVSVAAGKGKLAEAALGYLREKNREGHAGTIAAALKGAGADVASKIKELVLNREEKVYPELTTASTPGWLAKAVKLASALKPVAGSNFIKAAQLPAVVVTDKRLSMEQVASVLLALQHAETVDTGDMLAGLRQHADRASLDAFAWALFEQWIAEGAPPKQKWAMRSLGFLGSDAVALKLTPLIRAWPGESQHPRAVLGLECLRQIGTDTALMQLNGIAVKLKFKGLQNKAREFMEAIATEKGLTTAQLEDRIVPDCDLDERGSRVFDFGPRQFRFVLGPDMKPMLKDTDDKVKPDLPKPGAKDDAAKAEAAVNDWKLMKKQIKEVATTQAQRLEQAMVTGRRWPVADFETLLVKHPLMTNLVRLILWGGYDKKGKLTATFRVTEDQTYSDAKDVECTLKGLDSVGIVHPLNLTEDQKSAWGEIFSDYEIVPPFQQLGRPGFGFNKDELQSNEITRFSQVKIPCATLVFGLEKLGWTRGQPQDNGQVNGHSKYFPSADLSAVIIFEDGFPVGYREGWEDQKIADIYFAPGQYRVTWGRSRHKKEEVIELNKLDPVIASEVLSDLNGLAEKGK
jgi:predicted DNA-binding WGR domain protein